MLRRLGYHFLAFAPPQPGFVSTQFALTIAQVARRRWPPTMVVRREQQALCSPLSLLPNKPRGPPLCFPAGRDAIVRSGQEPVGSAGRPEHRQFQRETVRSLTPRGSPSLRRHGRLPERVGGTAGHPRTIETMGTGCHRAGSGPKWLEPKWLRTHTHTPPGGWWWFNVRMAGVPLAVAQAWW